MFNTFRLSITLKASIPYSFELGLFPWQPSPALFSHVPDRALPGACGNTIFPQ